ncbi:MAG: phosphoglycerate dehydrogenase [Elusimicrobiota bacterium]
MKILVTTSSFSQQDPAARAALTGAGFEIHENPFKRKLTEAEVLSLLAQHKPVGLFAGIEPLTAKALEASASHLKVISRCGIGLDTVDLDAAKRLGIKVFNTPDAPSQAVAELTIGLMLAVLRRIAEADAAVRRGDWKTMMGRLLGSRTVGVVGLGRIGSRVAKLASAFGSPVLAYEPRDAAAAPAGTKRASLEEVLKGSDIITLHVPMSPENKNLIDASRIAAMKPGAILINASRGGLVDEAALLQALKDKRLSGAGLDTFEGEPYKGPLKELPQVVLTPHMGSAAEECRSRMEREAADNLIVGLRALGVI